MTPIAVRGFVLPPPNRTTHGGLMKYRKLGRTGVQVSELCLGTMMFGGQTEEAESRRIIEDALERGVNFIDTADAYAETRSEEIVGRAIADKRDDVVLATKMFHRTREGINEEGLSRLYIMKATERSLKRLGTDHIDIQYLHKPDADTPLEETIAAVGDLIRQGKIRYFGLSNYRAWQIAEIIHLCRALGVPRPVVLQPYYNIMNRAPELEVLPAAHHYGLGIVPYSPIARGVLTGKYLPGKKPPKKSRAGREDRRIMNSEWRPESLEIAQTLQGHAETRGTSLVHFAVAWVLNNRSISSAIAGPRTFEQWQSYPGALDYEWTKEDEALVDSLVPPGHPSTPGYTDPQYPVLGRFPAIG